ncbi:MAG TPA: transposase, partial [Aggregatilineaceae bacterium]|nr:transposase [Aggregatilineaceae bacterium]
MISLLALMMGRYRLSKRQVPQFLWECFGIEMAASTVVNHQRAISQALAEPVAELQPYLQQQPACNIDETGWRQAGQRRRSWLWTVVAGYATLFRIGPSRSSQIARALLGETYPGVAGTDRCSAYTWLTHRQFSWSHLLRDF